MTKSKAAKQRRRMGGMSLPYARMTPGRGLTNWTVFSQALTASGQVIGGVSTPTSLPTWNPSGAASSYNLVSGSPVTFQGALIQPAVQGNIPTIGRMKIDEIKGKILLATPSASGYFSVAVGIYVSEFTQSTSAWDVSDPLVPSDAARDQWFFLEAKNCSLSLGSSIVASGCVEFDLKLSEPVIIGGGQALNVTVSMVASPNTLTVFANPAFRVRTGPVA